MHSGVTCLVHNQLYDFIGEFLWKIKLLRWRSWGIVGDHLTTWNEHKSWSPKHVFGHSSKCVYLCTARMYTRSRARNVWPIFIKVSSLLTFLSTIAWTLNKFVSQNSSVVFNNSEFRWLFWGNELLERTKMFWKKLRLVLKFSKIHVSASILTLNTQHYFT